MKLSRPSCTLGATNHVVWFCFLTNGLAMAVAIDNHLPAQAQHTCNSITWKLSGVGMQSFMDLLGH